jgi:hypothetical protein
MKNEILQDGFRILPMVYHVLILQFLWFQLNRDKFDLRLFGFWFDLGSTEELMADLSETIIDVLAGWLTIGAF